MRVLIVRSDITTSPWHTFGVGDEAESCRLEILIFPHRMDHVGNRILNEEHGHVQCPVFFLQMRTSRGPHFCCPPSEKRKAGFLRNRSALVMAESDS